MSFVGQSLEGSGEILLAEDLTRVARDPINSVQLGDKAGGKLLSETECPASEISGLVVSGDSVYVSEASTNTVYRMAAV